MASNHPTLALKSVQAEHRDGPGARVSVWAQFLWARLKVRSVHRAERATGFSGPAKVDSHSKRLQRFFRSFEIHSDDGARLRVCGVPVGDGPGRRTLDRTNGTFGNIDLNRLVLGIAHRGLARPVFWTVLGQAGPSNPAERIALMERFLTVFGADKIAAGRADRAFLGADGFLWLQQQDLPFHPRLQCDPLIPHAGNRFLRADGRFGSVKPGPIHLRPGRRPVGGCFVPLSALRLEDGELRLIARSKAPQAQAIAASADRGPIETRFGCLKTRGFHFEDPPLTDPERRSQWLGWLALAFAGTDRTGERLQEQTPLLLKKHSSDPSRPSFVTGSTFSGPSP